MSSHITDPVSIFIDTQADGGKCELFASRNFKLGEAVEPSFQELLCEIGLEWSDVRCFVHTTWPTGISKAQEVGLGNEMSGYPKF
jgi:hypothetical protein